MPFTVSHAVVALPFVRSPLVPGAIAIGAMSPDLPLFFPWAVRYSVTHSWPTMFVVGLPIALLLWATWRVILCPAAPVLAPPAIGRRLPAHWARATSRHTLWSQLWRRGSADAWPLAASLASVVASLAVGIASHVVWDSFTHEGRWGSEVLPVLADRWGPLEATQWVQHASSAVGLIVIAGWAARYLRRVPVRDDGHTSSRSARLRRIWLIALVLCGVVAVLVEVLNNGIPDAGGSAPLFRAGTSAGAAMLATTLIAAVAAGVPGLRANSEPEQK